MMESTRQCSKDSQCQTEKYTRVEIACESNFSEVHCITLFRVKFGGKPKYN